jgi:peroxiredoxin
MDVELLSVAPDSPNDWRDAAADYDIPQGAILLSDEGNRVAEAYDVMQWQAATGSPATPSSSWARTGRSPGSGTMGHRRTGA